eukprot:6927100-Alexandrium_andersonii.AAC.1
MTGQFASDIEAGRACVNSCSVVVSAFSAGVNGQPLVVNSSAFVWAGCVSAPLSMAQHSVLP